MKSLCDEILLRRVMSGGFNIIKTQVLISSKQGEDFIASLDAISFTGRVVVMSENKLADLSTDFTVELLKLTDSIKGHYSLINQLERSGTSIGANIREAKYAHSKADFISKLQISLKECYETEYWLELLEKSQIVSSDIVKPFTHDCGVIRKMLISSINTAKKICNTKKQTR